MTINLSQLRRSLDNACVSEQPITARQIEHLMVTLLMSDASDELRQALQDRLDAVVERFNGEEPLEAFFAKADRIMSKPIYQD